MTSLDTIDPDLLTNKVATLTTLGADGGPESTIVWFIVEDGKIVISATARRRKTKNLAADQRVSLVICHPDTPDYYVELRGTAELSDDADYTVADRIGPRYNADFRTFDRPNDKRLAITVTVAKALVTDVR